MKLSKKVFIVLIIVWIAAIGLILAGTQWFLVKSFLTLEDNQVHNNIYRANQALNQTLYSLATFTADWARWDDAYNYMLGKNPKFAADNIKLSSFTTSNINFLMYLNKQGKMLAGGAADLDTAKETNFPTNLDKYIYLDSLLVHRTDIKNDIRGLISLPSGIMFVAASAITNGDANAPIIGTLITGRYLSKSVIQKIADVTKLQIQLFTLKNIDDNKNLKNIIKLLIQNKGQLKEIINDNYITGYQLLKDINNQPIGILKIITTRPVYSTGIDAVKYYLIAIACLGFLMISIVWIFLRLLVLKRLENLNQQILMLDSQQDISKRVSIEGRDEISSVSKQINQMLTTIQQSHELLEERVEQRTEELKHTNLKLKHEIHEHQLTEQELLKHKENLAYLALHDNLTKLPNRLHFKQTATKAIEAAQRYGKMLALLFIDLDRFKNINDAFNHAVGDQCLKILAERLSKTLRSSDFLARLGGDEFIVLLTDISRPEQTAHVAQKLLNVLVQPIQAANREFYLNASIGISIFPRDGTQLDQLQKNADIAMYHAKKAGGGNFYFYNSTMDVIAHERLELEDALHKALANEEFFLYFQPKFNLKRNAITSVEALIRWRNHKNEFISPTDFIPIAEETGLINPIGEWVLKQACLAAKQWRALGHDISVAINLSAVQLHNQNLISHIQTALEAADLQAQHVEVEITETAIMREMELISEQLQNLHKMGLSISLDDFGKGYTSITYLKKFPISTIKIDQSFISGIPDKKNDAIITTALINLAHSLDLEVIAEGVETIEQYNYLLNNDCDIIQGYYISKPLPLEELLKLFAKSKHEKV